MSENPQANILDWNPTQSLKQATLVKVRYSKGFMQCDPSKWLPSLSKVWQTLISRFSVDLRILSVTPTMDVSQPFQHAYVATLDQEPLVFALNHESYRAFLDAFAGNIGAVAREVYAEYFARRFLKTLSDTWSGVKNAKIKYEPEFDFKTLRPVAAIEIKGSVNGVDFVMLLFLGRNLTDQLDGLWRRQLYASVQQNVQSLLRIELAALWLAPHRLSDYIVSGAVVDLQQTAGDQVNLINGSQPWKRARMYNAQGKLALELTGPAILSAPIVGATRLSFEFGFLTVDSHQLIELSQNGAFLETELAINSVVNVIINNQRVATARLGTYQGRMIATIINPV